jgi:hypothetical protein
MEGDDEMTTELLEHPDVGLLLRLTEAVATGQGMQRGERFCYFVRGWATEGERARLFSMRVFCACGCRREMCPVTELEAPLNTGRARVPAGALSVKFTPGYKVGAFSCARKGRTRGVIAEFHRRLIGAPKQVEPVAQTGRLF